MERQYLGYVWFTMLLFSLFLSVGATELLAQSNASPPPIQQEMQKSDAGQQPAGESPSSLSVPKSEVKGWFNRTGSGVFISLTPFATAVALSVILLLILIPFLIAGAKSRKGARGYFKTIPHAR